MLLRWRVWFFAILALTQTACGQASLLINTPEAPASDNPVIVTTTRVPDNPPADLSKVPVLDQSNHTVPLDEIIFDTFRRTNRAVPLTEADPSLIISLRDAIPPIYDPVFEEGQTAGEWLAGHDLVLGYAAGEQAFAYPINILNWHEMVSHEVDGQPTLATYCPLCRSGVVYSRFVEGKVLQFGNTSALYESDMVMFDHDTGSYWMQVSGEAIAGTMAGTRLQALPSQMTTWEQWQALFPQSQVLSRDTGHRRDYSRDAFAGIGEQYSASGRFAFPVSSKGRDERLPAGEIVLGVEINGRMRAYSLFQIGNGLVTDDLAGQPIVIFSSEDGPSGNAFNPVLDGRRLTFEFQAGQFRDLETNSIWNMAGQAINGPLSGEQLSPLTTRSTYWFSLVSAFPDLELYGGS